MSRVYSTECTHCPLTGPDRFGNRDLDINPACPVHGYDEQAVVSPAEYLTGDFHDAVQDRKAELAHEGKSLTTVEIVRASLAADRSRDVDRRLSSLARHPFGLPATGDLPPARATTPSGPHPTSPPGVRAEGSTAEQQPRRSRAEAA